MAASSVSSLVQSLGEIPPDQVVFGRTETMRALRERLDKVASANVPVLNRRIQRMPIISTSAVGR